MKTIELTRGFVAVVDDEDFERLSKFRWTVLMNRGGRPYARRAVGGGRCRYMSADIIEGRDGLVLTYLDGDGLNNRRSNIALKSRRDLAAEAAARDRDMRADLERGLATEEDAPRRRPEWPKEDRISRFCHRCEKETEWLPRRIRGVIKQHACRDCVLRVSKEGQRARRTKVLNHYGHRCACCGEGRREFLAIDHIAGGGERLRRRIGGGRRRQGPSELCGWLLRHNFPEGYQLLCHNCNQAKGSFGLCPHARERAAQVDPTRPVVSSR